jgi:hypothetical protein
MKAISKTMAATYLTLGLAVAALGGGPAALAQDEMHGVDMLHPGAQFAPSMPSGLTPYGGPQTPPAAASGGALAPSATVTSPGTPPGTSDIHRNPSHDFGSCTGAPASQGQQIGSDQTFCGFGKR